MDNKELDKLIGANIGKARAAAGMTQKELGEALPEVMKPQQISKAELGQNRLSAPQLFVIAQALGVPIISLLEGSEKFMPEYKVAPSLLKFAKATETFSPIMQSALHDLVQAIAKETSSKILEGNHGY